jgi:hypothetical protein
MIEALSSPESSVLTTSTRRNIPEDAIPQSDFVTFSKKENKTSEQTPTITKHFYCENVFRS